MASVKPILDASVKEPFDVSNGTVIKFKYNGNIPESCNFKILHPNTRVVIHSEENVTSSDKYSCIIPAGGFGGDISNGNSYLFTLCVNYYDDNHRFISSPWSDETLIYCYTTPTMTLINLPDRQGEQPIEITSPTITIGINYVCGEGNDKDDLNQFNYYVYKVNDTTNPILSSGTFTDVNTMYTIYGLDNNKLYYLRACGLSKFNRFVDTGLVPIVTHLGDAGDSSILSVENNKCEGNILVSTNIDTQGYFTERAPIVYYDPDPSSYQPGHSYDTDHPSDPAHIWTEYHLDATPQSGSASGYVCYTKGVLINGDFSGKVTFGQPSEGDRVFYFKCDPEQSIYVDNEITARYMVIKGLDGITITGAYLLLEVRKDGVVNNYTTGIFPKLTKYDIVDMSVGRKLISEVESGAIKCYYSYEIACKITTYNSQGEVVNEAWY